MVRLTRIYTRGGDAGETSLGDGARVSKSSTRVAAFGTVDEANSAVGIARLHATGDADAMLGRIQNDLFDLGADLCTPEEENPKYPPLRISSGCSLGPCLTSQGFLSAALSAPACLASRNLLASALSSFAMSRGAMGALICLVSEKHMSRRAKCLTYRARV